MARKSPWQQFADNYKSTKGAFDDMFTGLETKKIMDEEVETIHHGDAGLSHHAAAPTQWRYGGKTYDKQITAGELTGLRQARIADVMTKFGDHEGAMDYLTKQATLTNLGLDTEVKRGTVSEQIRAVKLKNDALVATMDLTRAQIDRYNKLTPLEAEKYLAEIAEQKRSTSESRALMPGKVEKQDAEVDTLQAELEQKEIELAEFKSEKATAAREGGLTQTLAEQANELKRTKLEGEVLTSTYQTELATHILNSGTAKTIAEAEQMAANQNKLNQEVLTTFATKMANKEFESPKDQKEWLMNNWTGDERVKTMIADIDAVQLAQITAEGTKTMAEIGNALSGKSSNAAKKALIKVIDGQDGIQGNMKFGTDEKGNTVLYEYSSVEAMNADKKGTGEGGEAVVTGHKNGWSAFTESLYSEFTPLKSLELAKTNADIQVALATAKKYNAEALIPPRDYSKEKWQTMVTQFMSSDTYFQAVSNDPDGSQGLVKKALDHFKAQYNTDPEQFEGFSHTVEEDT